MRSNELVRMFRYPSMIKSAAFCAACFAFLSVVFKNSLILIPEVTEVRFCNILACTLGIWFGPAGAWGCAVGNLVGDLGGSLTDLSFSGFFGNFFSAWLPYKVWCVWGSAAGEPPTSRPSLRAKNWLLRYLVGGFFSVVTCSAVLAVSFDRSGDMPAANTFAMIFLNNAGATLLGIALFALSCFLPEKLLVCWRAQMTDERELSFPASDKKRLTVLLAVSAALSVYMPVYMLAHGVTLRTMDAFGSVFPIALCIIYTAAQIIVTLSCRWKAAPRETQGAVSLD